MRGNIVNGYIGVVERVYKPGIAYNIGAGMRSLLLKKGGRGQSACVKVRFIHIKIHALELLPQLLEQLDAGECKGIKSATAYKIEEFARQQGYLE